MNKAIKTYKTSERFTELYGREAYETWKRREAEIDCLMTSCRFAKNDIIRMREDNYRQMKAAGEKRAAAAVCGANYRAAA